MGGDLSCVRELTVCLLLKRQWVSRVLVGEKGNKKWSRVYQK